MSGLALSDWATISRTVNDSGLSADLPVSKITPRRMTGVRSGVNRIGQPAASTRVPVGVPGQRSFVSSTPSPSESLKRWHPTSSTSAPGGVLGHLSSPSGTPSLSTSSGQPAWSTTAPAGVPGHWSRPSSTPSPSASAGQPLASTRAPAGVPGHWSSPSSTPSPSASAGQPLALTCAPAGVPGHWSSPSYTPSRSVSGASARIDRGADRRVGAGVAPVGHSVMVLVWCRAAPGEDGQTERADDVTRPVTAGEVRVGRVEATHFKAEGGSVAEKDPIADRDVNGIVREAVWRRLFEVEPGVPAEDIEEVAGGSKVQHQTGAAVSQCGRGAAGLRIGAMVARVELCADDVAEEVPQPTAAADLGVQVEDLVVTRERSERPELELVRALCREAGDPARERYS